MVKNRSAKIIAVAIGAVFFLWAGLVFAGGKAVKVPFTATEIMLAPTDLGDPTYPGRNYHVRDQQVPFIWLSPEPRLNGQLSVVVNMNLDSPPDFDDPNSIASGSMWGTFNFPANPDSYVDSGWEGSWHGQVFDLVKNILEHSGVGHGYGQFEGLQMKYSCIHEGKTMPITRPDGEVIDVLYGDCTGRILETKSKK